MKERFTLIEYKGKYPQIHPDAFIGDGVVIIGDVEIGENSSIWFNSVLRGDVAPIKIGENTNLQDGSVIHTSRFDGPVIIGNNVTIGHMALIHACKIQDNAFIGMRSMVMDHAIVEEYGFVAAGSVVTPNKVVKSRELWIGFPARCSRILSDEDIEKMRDTNKTYLRLKNEYKESCVTQKY
jgi:carbonic anhydrase/acetyltransferase-like protein (isoleucine patch superfamily)